MPKKYFRRFLPSHDSIRENRWIRPFGVWLQHHNLWHLHRRSVSGGVAVGMFCGLIPGPLQMLGAALLAVLFRVNLPIAMATTLYTNPFTIVPLYVLAYELGALVTGQSEAVTAAHFNVPDMNWDNWTTVLLEWIFSLGKPFAIGLPLLAIILAVLGYIAVRLGWRIWVIWQWRQRGKRIRGEMVLSFRRAGVADVAQIVALVNSAYRGESSKAGWTTEADLLDGQRTDAEEVSGLVAAPDSMVLLCLSGDEMIGSVHLRHGKHAAYLGMLAIKPALQGRGLGSRLIRTAEAAARETWGADKMLMYVVSIRHELIAYYERRGYRSTGKLKEFPQNIRCGIPKIAGLQLELLEKNFHEQEALGVDRMTSPGCK